MKISSILSDFRFISNKKCIDLKKKYIQKLKTLIFHRVITNCVRKEALDEALRKKIKTMETLLIFFIICILIL